MGRREPGLSGGEHRRVLALLAWLAGLVSESVSTSLPMFPLNAVIFPGVSVPLNVFEDRYRALVHHLLRVEDPTQRLFGSVGIREGYEVGDHGSQSLFRVGCRVQLTEVESHPDGTFSIVAVGLDRIQLERLDTTGTFPVGQVVDRPETGRGRRRGAGRAGPRDFTAYRAALAEIRTDPYTGDLPQDPSYLSWTLAACAPLPLHERQALLEAEDAGAPAADGHRPAPHRAARDERAALAAGHRRGPHPLEPQLSRSKRMTPAVVALRSAGVAFTRARVRPRPAQRVVRARGRHRARAGPGPGLQDPDGRTPTAGWSSPSSRSAAGSTSRRWPERSAPRRRRWPTSRDAERATGYVAGGISPFGQKRPHPTVVDETVELWDTVYVSGGRRGLDVEIAPADLMEVTGAIVADVAG